MSELDNYKYAFIVASSGFFACATFLIIQAIRRLIEVREAVKEQVILPEMESGLMRAFLPLARSFGGGARILLGGERKEALYNRFRDSVGKNLSAAGRPQGINADEYVGFGFVLGLFGGLIGCFAWVMMQPDPGAPVYWYFVVAGGLCALYWHSWLRSQKRSYQTSIRRSLPFCLDLLTLSIEAGLDFTASLGRLVRKMENSPLGKEFSLMLHEIQLGKTRSDALRDFSRRVDVAEVGTVVASMIQAEELGASLGPVLRILSAQQREKRSMRAEEMAMKAPVKILGPLTICLFPCIVIILAGPIILSMVMP